MKENKLNRSKDPDNTEDPNWNYDPRNESYYLGRINKSGNNDLDMRYYTDGHSDRYYRNDEMEEKNNVPDSDLEIKDPYKNNDFEGHRKRNYVPKEPHGGK
ncbi:MAG: hypothetical protein ABIR50_11625 [Ginsengibacter sp.]